ncbi:MAG TPA: CdaR family protein [Candidatus Limnocylindrales bacterium]|nr:CdaR family protein [Candidatus Limnocylindrales bacterium]
MTRYLSFVFHNWPLKLAAIGLATLLYGGLVLSQTTQTFPGNVQIELAHAPADVVVLSNPGAVTRIQYVAPPDLGLRINSDAFRATVDLAGAQATGGRVTLDVSVDAVDPRIQVLDFEPRAIVLTLDHVGSASVPIQAVLGPIPSGLDIGEPVVDATTATVTGPQSVVAKVTEVHANVVVDASGIDVNQMVTLVPVDSNGNKLELVDVEPAQVRVRVPVFTDRRSKTLPVTPNVVGTPAAGFEIASVTVDPAVVSVEGDANDLAGLDRADTQPVSVSGASSQVTQTVALALPDGVQALGGGTVQVTVTLRPVTGTRTFEAGLVLSGARSDLVYTLSTDHVLVTIGGSLADLDRLSGVSLTLSVDVTGLEPGTHAVAVSANLATGLTLVSASPNPVDVIVTSPATAPAPTPGPSPGPSPTP